MLSIEAINFAYDKQACLRNLSLEVAQGDILGLLGPNGAGKTTLVSLLAGLLTPASGQILIEGKPAFLGRPGLALVPQEYAFYTRLTGRENLEYFAAIHGLHGAARSQAVDHALDQTGLQDAQKQYASHYSGGLKRRLNLAIALLQKPRLLILDEPTANLDPQSRVFLLDMLRELNKSGVTIIYTSHLLDEVENLCNSVAVLYEGEIRLQGRMMDLLAEQQRLRIQLAGAVDSPLLTTQGVIAGADNYHEFDLSLLGMSPGQLLTQLEQSGAIPLRIQYGQRRLETVYMEILAHKGTDYA